MKKSEELNEYKSTVVYRLLIEPSELIVLPFYYSKKINFQGKICYANTRKRGTRVIGFTVSRSFSSRSETSAHNSSSQWLIFSRESSAAKPVKFLLQPMDLGSLRELTDS